ncbi:MAG: hypothetical protein ACRDRS_13760 [Pseudonocardiaceae bacterium]
MATPPRTGRPVFRVVGLAQPTAISAVTAMRTAHNVSGYFLAAGMTLILSEVRNLQQAGPIGSW